MKTAFIVMAETSRFASRLLPGAGNRDFFLSYGAAVPDVSEYDLVSYWSAGGYSARLRRIGLAGGFTAPGQAWLSTVDPEFTGRQIVTGGVSEMPENTVLFGKPAEAKIDAMIAGKYTASDVRLIMERENVPANTLFQWTESLWSINHEHRFYVCEGEIRTGSPYLIDGIVYHDEILSPRYDEALRAAKSTVLALGSNQPVAYTLDMGMDEVTGRWIIIEANPAWSSGIYGCDPVEVINVLDVACNTADDRWRWEPAEYLVEKALVAPKLEVVDPLDGFGIWKYQA